MRKYCKESTTAFNKKEYNKALALINKAIKLDDRNPILYFNRAIYYYNLGKIDEAYKNMRFVVYLEPKNKEILNNKLYQAFVLNYSLFKK